MTAHLYRLIHLWYVEFLLFIVCHVKYSLLHNQQQASAELKTLKLVFPYLLKG